jgi:autotransporter-associated beta strand protein
MQPKQRLQARGLRSSLIPVVVLDCLPGKELLALRGAPFFPVLVAVLVHVWDGHAQMTYTWDVDASRNWNTRANWSPDSGYPNAIDEVASFGGIITANRTVTLRQDTTIGTLNLDDNNNYTIAGKHALTFDVSSGNAAINVTAANGNGAHTISASISLNDPLVISQGSGGDFTISGIISGFQPIIKTGAGLLELSGENLFTGDFVVSGGTVLLSSVGALGGVNGTVRLDGGGTLTLKAVGNKVNDAAILALNGGTISANNFAETMGPLRLTASSTISLAPADGVVRDLVFSSASRIAGALAIENWAGTSGGGTDDRIFVTAEPDRTFLANVHFAGFDAGALWRRDTGELVPVPEPGPSVMLAGLVLLSFSCCRLVWRGARE